MKKIKRKKKSKKRKEKENEEFVWSDHIGFVCIFSWIIFTSLFCKSEKGDGDADADADRQRIAILTFS